MSDTWLVAPELEVLAVPFSRVMRVQRRGPLTQTVIMSFLTACNTGRPAHQAHGRRLAPQIQPNSEGAERIAEIGD